jgi:hypothetical protein
LATYLGWRLNTCHTGTVRHALRQALETGFQEIPGQIRSLIPTVTLCPIQGSGSGSEWGGPVPLVMERVQTNQH